MRPKELFYSVKLLPPDAPAVDTELPLIPDPSTSTLPNEPPSSSTPSGSDDEFYDCCDELSGLEGASNGVQKLDLQTGLTESAKVGGERDAPALGADATVQK